MLDIHLSDNMGYISFPVNCQHIFLCHWRLSSSDSSIKFMHNAYRQVLFWRWKVSQLCAPRRIWRWPCIRPVQSGNTTPSSYRPCCRRTSAEPWKDPRRIQTDHLQQPTDVDSLTTKVSEGHFPRKYSLRTIPPDNSLPPATCDICLKVRHIYLFTYLLTYSSGC